MKISTKVRTKQLVATVIKQGLNYVSGYKLAGSIGIIIDCTNYANYYHLRFDDGSIAYWIQGEDIEPLAALELLALEASN